ncbi:MULTISPECIES: NADH-quinone oxidoreductase subunit NuoN [Metallosphaera]|uniref:NADH dehydrogenase subunit N n=3 Tax=Metallosphaera TaxID=41980 RepID=A4YHZ1_METS5|nr:MULTISPECIES: NADH-quinone oxidoreductase subunit NuoN [Metallosphaera]ABP96043.1 NADH dehydrogenase subunit N [Metallosphaera sedula DSM 5348]AIM28027.1 NADH dehydrogenase subunit N [Metallosphaera sedula]AKV74860.1 NADH:ubiquinone oxidoreductase subunit N [Metallosphaera sedula]AKV77097.1 NADH:ubiquinone oxidoreductase subunit N [Metallosphaera sedula]AKV79348.1 NADH:ubiquinone oxidoreductase subunit N [Metallosphaera sedula]
MNLLLYLPVVIPSILILFSSLTVLFMDKDDRGYQASVGLTAGTLLVSLAILGISLVLKLYGYSIFTGSLYLDVPGYLLSIVTLVGTLIALAGLGGHMRDWKTRSSMLSLMMLTDLGVIYMSFAYDVLIILTGWAISSAATYAITMLRKDRKSVDAGIKYLILGLVSSSFMILGFAAYVVATGTLSLAYSSLSYPDLLVLGIALLSMSFLFKIGAFPFQGWLPDVYTMADRGSISFVSSVGKLVGIVPLLRILTLGDPSYEEEIAVIALFVTISILSMIVGNIVAYSRSDVASILSFSSIAQVGFILIGFAVIQVNTALAEAGIFTQILAYVIAQAGLFNFLGHLEKLTGTTNLEGLRGLAKGDRALAASSSILLLSLLGIPPILGFWGKLFLFESAYSLPWLVVIAVINSAASAGYYIPVIREMFREGSVKVVKSGERDSVIIAAVLSIVVGILAPLVLVVFG